MMPATNKTLYSIKHRLQSFRCAIRGVIVLFSKEPNAKIHLATALGVLLFGLIVKLTTTEWLFTTLAIGLVLLAEGLNTCIEYICDYISPERKEIIRNIKDVAAASVLIAAITAAVIGALIFIPKILKILL